MFYLVDVGLPYADIYFSEPTEGERVIDVLDEEYSDMYKYLIKGDSYERIKIDTDPPIVEPVHNETISQILAEFDSV